MTKLKSLYEHFLQNNGPFISAPLADPKTKNK